MYDDSYYFERLVLSTFLMSEASVNKYLQDNPHKDPRVVWQIHQYLHK